jgi:Aspartyl protease
MPSGESVPSGRARAIGTLLAAALGIPAAAAVAGTTRSPTGPVTVPLHRYAGALKTVSVTAGGSAWPFLFDTGGGLTLITPKLAARLGCTPFGRVTGFRMSGEPVHFRHCEAAGLDVSGVRLDHAPIAVFDLMALLPPELPELGGLLSLESFRDRPVTIDWAADRLVLETEASLAERTRRLPEMRMRLATGEDGASVTVLVEVAARRGSLWFLLDSGNLAGTLLAPHALALLGLSPPGSPPVLDRVSLEPVGLPAVTGPAEVRDLIYDGVFGEGFLGRGVFTLDLRSRRLWGTLASAP